MGVLVHIFHDKGFVHDSGRHERICATMTKILTRFPCVRENSIRIE